MGWDERNFTGKETCKNIITSRCATIGINHIIFMYGLATD